MSVVSFEIILNWEILRKLVENKGRSLENVDSAKNAYIVIMYFSLILLRK